MMPALAIAQLPKLPGLQQLVATQAVEEEVRARKPAPTRTRKPLVLPLGISIMLWSAVRALAGGAVVFQGPAGFRV